MVNKIPNKRHGFFLVMSYFVNKKFVKSQSTKNKLALKSEMNGSLLFVLFDLINCLFERSERESRLKAEIRVS